MIPAYGFNFYLLKDTFGLRDVIMVALISFMSLLFQQITLVSGWFRGVDITYVTLRTRRN